MSDEKGGDNVTPLRKPLKNATLLDASIQSAQEGDGVVKSAVTILPGRNRVVSQQIRKTPLPDVTGSIVKIIDECDPLQFLIDLVAGKAVEAHIVTAENEVLTVHEVASLQQRISIAKYLANKYMPNAPRLSLHRHKMDMDDEGSGGAGSPRSFTQIVTHAASRDRSE